MLDQQLFVRRFLDGARDPLAVMRSKDQCAQDQQVQRALQQLELFLILLGRHITRVSNRSGKMSTQESIPGSQRLLSLLT